MTGLSRLLAECEAVPNEAMGSPCLINNVRTPSGYYVKVNVKGRGGMYAHRLVWELANGRRVSEGFVIHHKCHNRRCLQALHLEPRSVRSHSQIHKPRQFFCRKHKRPYDYRKANGTAVCVVCRAEQDKRHRDKKLGRA